MTEQTKKDIKTVLDYLWHDEKKHYQYGPSKKHIFVILRRLADDIRYRAS